MRRRSLRGHRGVEVADATRYVSEAFSKPPMARQPPVAPGRASTASKTASMPASSDVCKVFSYMTGKVALFALHSWM
jgi:hypothetical protein